MAVGDVFVKINGVQYGGTGLDAVVMGGLDIQPSFGSERGTATIRLQKVGGGFNILPKHQVQIYVQRGASTYRALFGGFVETVKTDQMQMATGQFLVLYDIQCTDYNSLLDELVQEAGAASSTGACRPSRGTSRASPST
jgi:hypothetical protein